MKKAHQVIGEFLFIAVSLYSVCWLSSGLAYGEYSLLAVSVFFIFVFSYLLLPRLIYLIENYNKIFPLFSKSIKDLGGSSFFTFVEQQEKKTIVKDEKGIEVVVRDLKFYAPMLEEGDIFQVASVSPLRINWLEREEKYYKNISLFV